MPLDSFAVGRLSTIVVKISKSNKHTTTPRYSRLGIDSELTRKVVLRRLLTNYNQCRMILHFNYIHYICYLSGTQGKLKTTHK